MSETNLQASGGKILTLGSLDNPNKMPFKGVLTYLGVPSDNPPGGSGGYKVMIPVETGRSALDSLKGMPVNLAAQMDTHDTDAVVGIFEDAFIGEVTAKGTPIYVSGHIFAKSFPTEAQTIKASQTVLGFSYETARTKLELGIYKGETVAVAKELVFTGAAILFKDSAAYESTSIAASKESEVKDQVKVENVEATEVIETAEVTASEEVVEVDAKKVEAEKAVDKKKPAEGSDEEEAQESPEEEAKEEEDEEKGKKPKDKDDLKASIDTLAALVTKLSEDVAELKAAKVEPQKVEEQPEEEVEVEAAAQPEPQRRSDATLVAKFENNEESDNIYASIDKKQLNTVDSMAAKLVAMFGK